MRSETFFLNKKCLCIQPGSFFSSFLSAQRSSRDVTPTSMFHDESLLAFSRFYCVCEAEPLSREEQAGLLDPRTLEKIPGALVDFKSHHQVICVYRVSTGSFSSSLRFERQSSFLCVLVNIIRPSTSNDRERRGFFLEEKEKISISSPDVFAFFSLGSRIGALFYAMFFSTRRVSLKTELWTSGMGSMHDVGRLKEGHLLLGVRGGLPKAKAIFIYGRPSHREGSFTAAKMLE